MVDIILDIDSVGDDILALIYAALHEKINVLGVTTVNGACGSIEQATWVAINTIELTGKDIPVYEGAADMLAPRVSDQDGDPVNFDEELRWKFGDRLDKFNEKANKPSKLKEVMEAKDFMIDTFIARPGEVILVTTGPLTNVAIALQKAPEIARKVKHAYILGGTFKTPGNITPVVEYNIWADPEAAKIVLNSGMEITLVPLDVCENNAFADSMMTRDHLFDIQEGTNSKVAEYVVDKFPIYIDIWKEYFQLGGFPMDDVITVALAADDDLCKYSDKVYVDVELEGELARGQTIAYFGRQILKNEKVSMKNVRIAQSVEGKRFMNLFVETIIK